MKLTEEQWKERVTLAANEKGHMFNGWYGEYKRQKTKLRLYCSEHGEWTTTSIDNYTNKKRTSGCPSCGKVKYTLSLRKSLEDFVLQAETIHGQRYDYSSTAYTNSSKMVSIRCKHHGYFEQLPANHLKGSGCPLCAGHLQNQAYIHLVKDLDTVCALKLGIARDWLKRMLHQNKRNTFQVENVGVWQFNSVMRCKAAERECKQTLKTGVLNERELKDGWTETVSVLDLEKVIAIYEKHGGKRIK